MHALLAAVLSHSALARDLHGQVGVGFESQLSGDGALSGRYWLPGGKDAPLIGVEGVLGMNLDPTQARVSAGARAMGVFLVEDNLNLYGAAGIAWVGGPNVVRIQPAIGAEFFLFGLENLGVTAEWGLDVDLGSAWRVATPGHPVTGVRYYF